MHCLITLMNLNAQAAERELKERRELLATAKASQSLRLARTVRRASDATTRSARSCRESAPRLAG